MFDGEFDAYMRGLGGAKKRNCLKSLGFTITCCEGPAGFGRGYGVESGRFEAQKVRFFKSFRMAQCFRGISRVLLERFMGATEVSCRYFMGVLWVSISRMFLGASWVSLGF